MRFKPIRSPFHPARPSNRLPGISSPSEPPANRSKRFENNQNPSKSTEIDPKQLPEAPIAGLRCSLGPPNPAESPDATPSSSSQSFFPGTAVGRRSSPGASEAFPKPSRPWNAAETARKPSKSDENHRKASKTKGRRPRRATCSTRNLLHGPSILLSTARRQAATAALWQTTSGLGFEKASKGIVLISFSSLFDLFCLCFLPGGSKLRRAISSKSCKQMRQCAWQAPMAAPKTTALGAGAWKSRLSACCQRWASARAQRPLLRAMSSSRRSKKRAAGQAEAFSQALRQAFAPEMSFQT